MRVAFQIVLLFCALSAFGQFSSSFSPSPYLDTIPAPLHAQLKSRLEQTKESTEKSTSRINSFTKYLYEKRLELIVSAFNEDYFIIEGELYDYLQSIVKRIYEANPLLASLEAEVYPYRSSIPNAISFGDGTVGFMLGLLERMENEDQVAFVISHELAHVYANHSGKRIEHLAKLNYDKDVKRKLGEARRSEFESYSKLKSVARDLGISLSTHSRDHEMEADSIGFIFYTNAKYSQSEAFRVMEILDSVDVPLNHNLIDFKKRFDLKDFAFKEKWQEYTKSTTWHKPIRDTEDDTLRTHPECAKRKRMLQEQARYLPIYDLSDHDEQFTQIKTQAQFDLIDSEFHYKQYGRSLFRSLQLLSTYPENGYLHAMVGRSLFQLYQHQKRHELGKVLELPDPRFPENYDRFLTFVHKLRILELASLAYYYLISQHPKLFEQEEYMVALWEVSFLEISVLDPGKIKADYEHKYPKGRHNNKLKFTY